MKKAPKKLSIPGKTMRRLMKSKTDAREVETDEVTVLLHLVCSQSKIDYFVFGAQESGRDDVTLTGHVVGERYPYVPIFIQCELSAIQDGNWFGEEVPTINPHFRPGQWGKIKHRHVR